jgi:hypothetical protein
VLKRAAAASLTVASAVALWLVVGGLPIEQAVQTRDATPVGQFGYFVQLQPWSVVRPFVIDFDSSVRPKASALRLTEDGRPLGPSHADHASVGSEGRGRYSHWGDPRSLYFSTSDHSDPRANGRQYRVATMARLPPEFAAASALLIGLAVWLERAWLRRTALGFFATLRRACTRPAVRANAAMLGAAYLGWAVLVGAIVEAPVDNGLITHEQGHAFRLALGPWRAPWPLRVEADTARSPRASTLVLSEDGRPLGPAHTEVSRIAAEGGGRYLHWGEGQTLYFSTPDNSDPRTNGRKYSIRVVARASVVWLVVVSLLLVLAAVSAWRLVSARMAAMGAFLSVAKSRVLRVAIPPRVRAGLQPLGRGILWLLRMTWPSALGSVVAVLLIFGAGELYLRWSLPFTETRWPSRYVDGVGWLFEPSATVRWTNDLDFWVEEKTNADGFLDRDHRTTSVDGHCRVALIGDSFVEAAQVRNDEKVQALLPGFASRRGFDRPIEASAYGFSGTGQLNQLPFYERYAKSVRPHLVVLVFVSNDFANNSSLLEGVRNGFHPEHFPRMSARFEGEPKRISLVQPDSGWQRHLIPVDGESSARECRPCAGHRALLARSVFYRWIVAKLRLLAPGLIAPLEPVGVTELWRARVEWLAAHGPFAHAFGGWRGSPDIDEMFFEESLPPAFAQALDLTEFAFAEFKRRVERDGASLVVLVSSSVHRPGLRNPDRYAQRFSAIASKLNLRVLDQFEWLQRQGEPLSSIRFPHDGHWNQRGHEVAAEMIAEYLARHPESCHDAVAPGRRDR